MSKTKPAKLKIYNREPGNISTGANTVVELNGQQLPLVSFLKLEFKPAKVAKITLEMLVDVDVEVESELLHTGSRNLEGDYNRYVIGRYETAFNKK